MRTGITMTKVQNLIEKVYHARVIREEGFNFNDEKSRIA